MKRLEFMKFYKTNRRNAAQWKLLKGLHVFAWNYVYTYFIYSFTLDSSKYREIIFQLNIVCWSILQIELPIMVMNK